MRLKHAALVASWLVPSWRLWSHGTSLLNNDKGMCNPFNHTSRVQVAIKKVLQDKRFKNRELQIIRMMEHPNVVLLKHCFFSVTDADERFLHLVLEFIPSTVYKCA